MYIYLETINILGSINLFGIIISAGQQMKTGKVRRIKFLEKLISMFRFVVDIIHGIKHFSNFVGVRIIHKFVLLHRKLR